MKPQLYIRLFIVVLVTCGSILLFSYVHARTARAEDPCNEGGGKCGQGKARTEYILWESLTHNLLVSNR